MRATISAAALIALPLTTMASTLNDWSPRLSNLDARCEAVYTKDISGCSEADFQPVGAICSAACVAGLQDMTAKVKAACGDEDFGSSTQSENILVCFLAGNGPQRVCPNNPISQTGQASTVAAKPATTSTTSSRSEITTATSSQPETSTASSKTSSSEEFTASTVSTSPTSTLLFDTTSVTSSPTSTASSSQDSQNPGTGGGSPFDDVSSGDGIAIVPVTTSILMAILFTAMMQ